MKAINKKMLTLNQIIKLYEEGIEIEFSKSRKEKYLKGYYEFPEITIYTRNIESREDMHITILHELIHARNQQKNNDQKVINREKQVEKEAQKTYSKRPHLIELIKNIYNIDNSID